MKAKEELKEATGGWVPGDQRLVVPAPDAGTDGLGWCTPLPPP